MWQKDFTKPFPVAVQHPSEAVFLISRLAIQFFPLQFVFCLIPTEPPQFPLFISSEKYFTRFKAPDLNKTILFLWRKIEIYFKTKNKLIPSKFLKLLLSFLKITFRLSNKRLFLVRRKQFSMKRENGFFARNDIFKIIHKDSVVFLHSQNIAWVLKKCCT